MIGRIVLVAATLAVCLPSSASAATKWLCGPGVANDPCRPSLSTTVYRGWTEKTGTQTPKRDRDHGVDCFYVYPTVSDQKTRLATKRVDPALRSIALYQAARFSQVCRVYAPVYRQATVTALQAGKTTKRDYLTAYGDVEEAFDAFLRRIGPRRGFVLLGHSQGTFHLQRLIRRKIDAKPALRRRLVSAVLLGGDVTVRNGSDRDGSFRHIPTCRSATQRGCVLAFSTFGETPPATAIFGRGASRHRRLSRPAERRRPRDRLHQPGSARERPERATDIDRPGGAVRPGHADRRRISLLGLQWPAAPTTFVEADGAFTGACSREGGAHVLRIAPAPGTPPPKASPTADWGLHLVDANIALGELVQVVRRQIRAFR